MVFFLSFLWATFVQPLFDWLSPKHAPLPFATPRRDPPNPKYFPFYVQNRDGLWLHWAQWLPDPTRYPAPRGVVFLVSGLGEHTARYDFLGHALAAEGFACFSHDHQGQGLSEGNRRHVEKFSNFVDDLEDFIVGRLGQTPGLAALPRFVLGHSMGGLITTHLALRFPDSFNGIVLSAPLLAINADATPAKRAAAHFLSRIMPKLAVGTLATDTLARNRQVLELYEQDPGVFPSPIRARHGSELMKAVDRVYTNVGKHGVFPYLALHGSGDTMVPLCGTERFHQESPSEDKRLVVYPGAMHEFFTDEQVGDKAVAEVVRFLVAHLHGSASRAPIGTIQ